MTDNFDKTGTWAENMAENKPETTVFSEENCLCCAAGGKTKHRSEEKLRALKNRLSRIEGQVRGVRNMLENEAYCTDVLMQVSAIQAALNAFSRELLFDHIHSCVAEGIRLGNDEVIDELTATLQKLMK